MDTQNKHSIITWSSYASVLVAFISAWASGALSAIDAYGPYWELTLLQVIFVPVVGIGIGLAISEGVTRVAPGASISEYVEEATGEVEKFLQAGLGTSEDTAKRVTGRWKAKAGETIDQAVGKVKPALGLRIRRNKRNSGNVLSTGAVTFLTPGEVLAEFWQVAHAAFAPPKDVNTAKVRVATVLAGRATEVVIVPAREYDPSQAEPRQAYFKRRTRVMLCFAVLAAIGFAVMTILKVVGLG